MKMKSTIIISTILLGSLMVTPPTTRAVENHETLSVEIMEQENVTAIPNTNKVEKAYDDSFLSVTGFAAQGVNDRSEYIDTDYYRTAQNAREFLKALADAKKGEVKVIEITEDIDFGWRAMDLSKEEQKEFSMIKEGKAPSTSMTNPLIIESGISDIKIDGIDGLTIFSQTGNTINHTNFNMQSSANDMVFRNLAFDGMWQWDDSGKHKEAGWSYMQVNGATNVWIDHCKFTMAADGIIDLKNGGTDVTLSWNEFGLPADENPDPESAIYQSIHYMEDQYQAGTLPETSLYRTMREEGATINEIMAYTAFHSKVHLAGSGDKDYVDYVRSNGEVVRDGNNNIRLTMAYNHYTNVAQRLPMVRQGVGHTFNNYFDNSTHQAVLDRVEAIQKHAAYTLSRSINARNGASIAGDTNVYLAFDEPVVGAERQGDDTSNMNAPWDELFKNAKNHFLLVNSQVTNTKGETYVGSTWDNHGENPMTTGIVWDDKSTIGNWAWSSSINGVENMDKEHPPADPFSFTYHYDEKLSYRYQTVPLTDVVEVVQNYAGNAKIELSAEEWLKTEYGFTAEATLGDTIQKYLADGALNDQLGKDLLYRVSIIDQLLEQKQNSVAVEYLEDFRNYIGAPAVLQQGLLTPEALDELDQKADAWMQAITE